MFVECPHCHALYRIKPHHLSAAEGWVRCGECGHIFEAQETLSEEDEQYLKIPPPPPPDESAQQDHVAQAILSAGPPGESAGQQAIESSKNILTTTLWSLSIVALLVLLVGQFLLGNRAQLAQIPSLRPLLSPLCKLDGCTLPPLRALQNIELLSRNIFTPPHTRHVLAMMATIKNTASFPQPYPLVQISFANLQGKIVAVGVFKPAQYLPHHPPDPRLMPSNTPVSIEVAFNDPGPQAVSYEFSFH